MTKPHLDFLAESSLPVLKKALVKVSDKNALRAADIIDSLAIRLTSTDGSPEATAAVSLLCALSEAARERARHTSEDLSKNGVSVIVYRTKGQESYVVADCTCYGEQRAHSNPDCPNQKNTRQEDDRREPLGVRRDRLKQMAKFLGVREFILPLKGDYSAYFRRADPFAPVTLTFNAETGMCWLMKNPLFSDDPATVEIPVGEFIDKIEDAVFSQVREEMDRRKELADRERRRTIDDFYALNDEQRREE